MGIVVDYTAYKLSAMADELEDPEDIEVVLSILAEYYEGEIAIAWEDGCPVVMPLSEAAMTAGIPAGFTMVGYDSKQVEE